jgi:two-component system phosphate regulon sensor histidine kinase PhoR
MSDQLASIDALAANLGVRLTLMDSDGRVIRGDSARTADASGVTRSLRETGLPWTLQASLIEPGAAQALSGQRRTVFTAGFALMLLVIAGAGFVMFRAVHRELRVAQLQADFVAAVSHEFRTPLAAMCHLTEMLEEGGEEGGVSAERLPQYYQALGRESRRLSGMVERLLDFGRIDAGRRRYELVETDPQELVTEVVQMCRDQAPASAHRVRWDRPSPASPTSGDAPGIRADREALGLALRNLIDNAIKYSPDTSPVTVTLTSQGQFVRIAVSDEGAGIPKDEQRAIFRKFARGSAAQAMNVKGTGIGLAMTGQIVKAHGGRVEVESHPGRGSTFTVVLPAVRGVRLQPDLANRNPAKAGSHGA